MKKINIIFVLFILFSLGISMLSLAQTTGKKKKKKRNSGTVQTDDAAAAAEAANIARASDSLLKALAGANVPKSEARTPDSVHTDGLVADTSQLSAMFYPLDSTRPVDGMYKVPLLRGAKPYAFPKPDKYNITFYKRIWRTIDVRDSMNRIFSVPGETMIQYIMDAIKNERLIAYKTQDFTSRLSYSQVIKSFSDSQTVMIPDMTGADSASRTVFNDFNPDSVTMFELKEDIFFDKARGRIVTQIVGLAPKKKLVTTSGDFVGYTYPFWLYYPQCRTPFASKEIFDTQRDIYNVSFDDIFISHNFKSVIVQESNPAGSKISDKYPNNEEMQKKEGERIEQEIRNYKKNVWKY